MGMLFFISDKKFEGEFRIQNLQRPVSQNDFYNHKYMQAPIAHVPSSFMIASIIESVYSLPRTEIMKHRNIQLVYRLAYCG